KPAAPLEPLAGLLETARANSPERKALEARVGAAGERIVAAQAAKLPNIALDGGYDAARPNPKIFPRQAAWKRSFDIGASLSWTLFDGGRARAAVAESSANRRAVEERLRALDTRIDVDVRQRAADLNSAKAAIQAAEAGVRS